VLIFSLAALVLAIAAGAIGNAATSAVGYDPVWNYGADDLAWSVALQLALIMSAFGLGLLLLNTAAAIAVFYVSAIMLRFIVYPIIFGFVDSFLDIAPYLDVFFGFAVAQGGQNLHDDAVSGLARFAPMVVSTLLWTVIPIVAGWLRATRSEVK
jgi:ABC-2 type transport system permease protein